MFALAFLLAAVASAASPARTEDALAHELEGVRSLAMGGAHRGVGTSNDTIYLNPGGMALVRRYAIELQYGYSPHDRLNQFNISAVDSKSGPVAGALGGYLTGSNTGAGAVSMPLATALVPAGEARLAVIAAAVVAGSLLTAVSPVRVTMGQVLIKATTGETGQALRSLWPWFALVVGLTTAIALAAAQLA